MFSAHGGSGNHLLGATLVRLNDHAIERALLIVHSSRRLWVSRLMGRTNITDGARVRGVHNNGERQVVRIGGRPVQHLWCVGTGLSSAKALNPHVTKPSIAHVHTLSKTVFPDGATVPYVQLLWVLVPNKGFT